MSFIKKTGFAAFVMLFVACGNVPVKKPRQLTDSARAVIRYQAQDHLIDILTVMRLNGADSKDFNFMIKYTAENAGKNDYLWGRVFAMQNDSFKCVISRPLPSGSAAKEGDTVKVSQGQVQDWKISDLARGNKFGDYTAEYLKGAN